MDPYLYFVIDVELGVRIIDASELDDWLECGDARVCRTDGKIIQGSFLHYKEDPVTGTTNELEGVVWKEINSKESN